VFHPGLSSDFHRIIVELLMKALVARGDFGFDVVAAKRAFNL
jgi:hypothetical protein